MRSIRFNFRAEVHTLQELNAADIRVPTPVDYARLFTVSAIWGATFLCNEVALLDFSPVAIAAYRILLAAMLLTGVCLWRGLFITLKWRTVGLLACVGLLNSALPFVLIGWGQLSIDSATTGILLASSPFVTLVLSHFTTRDDRFAWNKFAGLCLGFAGICMLFGDALFQGGGTFTDMLAIVLAGACYAASSILIRHLSTVPSLVLAACSLLAACVAMVPLLLLLDPPWQQGYRSSTLAAIVLLGLGPTAICYVLRAQIVKLNGAVFMSNVGYLIPVFAVLWGWLVLGHQPDAIMLVALVLILSGIGMGQNRVASLMTRVKAGS